MILLFGGTQEGREAALALKKFGKDVIVSVVSTQGVALLEKHGIKTICGRLDAGQIEETVDRLNIRCIVDATHPFAVVISQNLIDVCEKKGLPLIRIERKKYEIPKNPLIKIVSNIKEAAELSSQLGEIIFLTIGSQGALEFSTVTATKDKKLVTRVLPTDMSVDSSVRAGFQRENIITGMGPFGVLENIRDFSGYNVDVVVSKESGRIGGLPEKIEAALELGINVVLITCPPDLYKDCSMKNLQIIDLENFEKALTEKQLKICT